jgi:hypothetical protein
MHALKSAQEILLAVLTGSAGGFLFYAIGFPAPWLAGSVVAVSAAVLARLPVSIPPILRQITFLILGISIGSGIDPNVLSDISKWPVSLAALAISTVLIIAASAAFLTSKAGWSRTTAFYASVPGALSYVLATSLRSSADTPLVILAQLLRVISLLLFLPLITTASAEPQIVQHVEHTGYWGVAIMILGGVAVGYALDRVRFPAGMLFGGMAASGVLHITGVLHGQIPAEILVPSQILLGCLMGLRFTGSRLGLLAKALLPSAGAFLIALCISGAIALLVSWGLDLPINQLLIAFAPGALEVMIILAFVLGVDPAFVAAHHLVRFIGIALFLPFLIRIFLGNQPRD